MLNFRLSVAVVVTIALAGCAGNPAQKQSAKNGQEKPSPAVAALYTRLADDEKRYFAARDLATFRADEAAATASYQWAWNDAQDAAALCAKTHGCDTAKFDVAFARMSGQAVAAAPAGEEATTPEATTNAGEISAVAAAVPEVSRTVTLLKGRELSEVMTLNGPVKVALEEWLTTLRPFLMDTYENYQYMRYLMWPEYEKAKLPEAILFGIMAKESGGRVHAYSRSGAAGLLQFMPATGQRFGLGFVDGFDQRYDPQLAARANAAYLNEQLAILNNNLEMVIAAYNGGEGRMQRLAKNAPDASFWDPEIFAQLPPETRDYVPVVLAAAWLYLHPEKYNLVFPKIDGRPGTLVLQKRASLAELAVCLGSEGNAHDGWFRTLRNLNASVDPREPLPASTPLRVPLQLVTLYEKNCMRGVWGSVASDLHEAVLATPVQTALVSATRRPPPPPPVAKARSRAAPTYVVRRGETLSSIARKFGCGNANELAHANGIKPRDVGNVHPGRVLQVGVCTR
ncbi:MAG: transglycosylase SLT domain-containing protein [Proteobacteria bacterium]|uniref:transglycosylase SLT domain-containing protein n=1 Tax=Rudaea sp. TaxID=2136325 RepID=UPI001DB5C946|nr:transglycosylase SLT domain-containing protein [Pseudomonadota bacterium]MBS0565968.1 transglycosylase SLT domain-containing protein [Pseudomonadota bacterium]